MAKILVFSNQKGGTGKSTMCIQFANYLSAKGESVAVLDADPQQSIYHLRQRETQTNPDVTPIWQVWQLAGQSNVKNIMEKAKAMEGWILIDCPGTINDKNLLPIFEASDAAIIPFRYDDFVVDSTISFVKVLKQRSNAKIFFLPNIIDVRVKMPNEETIREMFKKVGHVLPRIKQGVAIQRLSTLVAQDEYQRKAVMFTIDDFIENLKLT